jgi:hypothetical protein
MRLQHTAMLVLCVLGCADTNRAKVDSGRDAGSLRPRAIELSGNVFASSAVMGPLAFGPPVEGAEVCRDGVRDCVTTDVYGRFTLGGIIPETETLLVISKEGFTPTLQAVVAPSWSSEIGFSFLFVRADNPTFYERWNAVLRDAGRPELDDLVEAGDSRALIVFGAGTSSTGALTDRLQVELEPGSGEMPLFVLVNGDWVLEVPAGQAAVSGIYPNLEPRADGYELVYKLADGECRQTSNALGGWPSARGLPNATRVPARAGHVTWTTSQRCKFADAGTADDAGQD